MIKLVEAGNGYLIEGNRPSDKAMVFTSKLELLIYLDRKLSGKEVLNEYA